MGMNFSTLLDRVPVKRLRGPIYYYDRVESTQDIARRFAEGDAAEGTIVIAAEQSGGRGRLGRSWSSPRGGLWMSILLRPSHAGDVSLIGFLGGLAIVRAIRSLTGLSPSLKWPNDVQLQGKKVAGILLEADVQDDEVRYGILGMGVNLNVDIDELPPDVKVLATSVREVLKGDVDLTSFTRQVLIELDALLSTPDEGGTILNELRATLSTLGRRVKIETRQGAIVGIAEGITRDGGLRVLCDDRSERVIYAGDVMLFEQ